MANFFGGMNKSGRFVKCRCIFNAFPKLMVHPKERRILWKKTGMCYSSLLPTCSCIACRWCSNSGIQHLGQSGWRTSTAKSWQSTGKQTKNKRIISENQGKLIFGNQTRCILVVLSVKYRKLEKLCCRWPRVLKSINWLLTTLDLGVRVLPAQVLINTELTSGYSSVSCYPGTAWNIVPSKTIKLKSSDRSKFWTNLLDGRKDLCFEGRLGGNIKWPKCNKQTGNRLLMLSLVGFFSGRTDSSVNPIFYIASIIHSLTN